MKDLLQFLLVPVRRFLKIYLPNIVYNNLTHLALELPKLDVGNIEKLWLRGNRDGLSRQLRHVQQKQERFLQCRIGSDPGC